MNKKKRELVSIFSDYGFKVIFANESDTTFLRVALQALIKSDVPIRAVKFLSNEFIGITEEGRSGVYDMICEDEDGRFFIVEMQKAYYEYFIHRIKFYAFHKFNTLVAKGDYEFDGLPKIYTISFLVKNVFLSEHYYHYGTLSSQRGELMDDQITHIIVEMAKFDKKIDELENHKDKLIFTMKNLENINNKEFNIPDFWEEDWVQKAIGHLDKNSMTPDERFALEISLAREGSWRHQQKRLLKEKEEEVTERVTQEVTDKVTQEVTERVTQDVKRKKDLLTAKKLKEENIPIDVIIKVTGLTAEEIEEL